MNQIYIAQYDKLADQGQVLNIPFENSDKYLQILRNSHFNRVTVSLPIDINDKQLRFMMHLSRILKQNGQIHLQNNIQSNETLKFTNLASKLGLFLHKKSQNQFFYSKNKPEEFNKSNETQKSKLSIGFKSLADEEIDEDDLMKNENLNIQKTKAQNCAQKPRACANCNCGRKNNQQPSIEKEKLVQSVNEGKPVSGCGKCYLGDSFRCGSCPYKGLPAFKPGDKLKLMDEGQVVVQAGEVKVQSGKVKIQL